MPLSQRSAIAPQELGRLDRRTVLKLCAASLSATALGTSLSSCGSGSDKRPEAVFKEVTRAQLTNASGAIARTLLGFLEQGISNDAAPQCLATRSSLPRFIRSRVTNPAMTGATTISSIPPTCHTPCLMRCRSDASNFCKRLACSTAPLISSVCLTAPTSS